MSHQQAPVAGGIVDGFRCGSVFANTVIKSLTSTNGVAMQPEDPDDNQVATFNAYTRSIIDICRSDVTRFWDQPNFTFSAQDDDSEEAWDGRMGIPSDIRPNHFRDRWNQLYNVPYAGDVTTKTNMDPHSSNTSETVTAQPGPTGGVPCPADLREDMTTAMISGDVPKMAWLFRQTCPGEWSRGWGVGLSTMLKDAVRHGIEPEKRRVRRHIDIAEFIRYRWRLAEMADSFVQEHKLRKPNNDICILWNDLEWSVSARQTTPGYGDRFGSPLRPIYPVHGSAIALTDLSQEDNDRVLQSLVWQMDQYKEFFKKICVEDKRVLQKGREWQEAIGR